MKPTTTAGTAKKPAARKTTAKRRKAPARPKTAAQPKVEETVQPEAQAPAVEPEVQSPPPAPPEAAAPPPPEPPAVEAAAPIAGAERVAIGSVEGALMFAPTGDVLGLLGEDLQNRVAILQGSEATSDLAARMRGTDGRCAPVYFTVADGDQPKLFSGVETIAAARDLGLDTICVIVVRAGDGDYLQAYLQAQMHKRGDKAETEDELIYRAMADDE